MILGIPRGAIYYDYISFIRTLFKDTDITLKEGPENNENILERGSAATVDEACLPIKLLTGQCEYLKERCDRVLILKVMKDINGRWLCPKILGQTQLITLGIDNEKLLITDSIFLNNKKASYKNLWKMFKSLGIDKDKFKTNFLKAYNELEDQNFGNGKMHVETAWEFVPETPKPGEIILPNTRKILLSGHYYNVYDKFSNNDIVRRLDELAIDTITEKDVEHKDQEAAIKRIELMKVPYWESVVRTLGTAVHLQDEIDGIIYLSSFSCGLDAIVTELIKKHVKDIPVMILKIDGHKGMAGYLTRIEAFADLLEKRSVS